MCKKFNTTVVVEGHKIKCRIGYEVKMEWFESVVELVAIDIGDMPEGVTEGMVVAAAMDDTERLEAMAWDDFNNGRYDD